MVIKKERVLRFLGMGRFNLYFWVMTGWTHAVIVENSASFHSLDQPRSLLAMARSVALQLAGWRRHRDRDRDLILQLESGMKSLKIHRMSNLIGQ